MVGGLGTVNSLGKALGWGASAAIKTSGMMSRNPRLAMAAVGAVGGGMIGGWSGAAAGAGLGAGVSPKRLRTFGQKTGFRMANALGGGAASKRFGMVAGGLGLSGMTMGMAGGLGAAAVGAGYSALTRPSTVGTSFGSSMRQPGFGQSFSGMGMR